MFTQGLAERRILSSFLIMLLYVLCTVSAEADKVSLDPSNWGLKEGEDCVSCHKKASAGLTHEWEASAHAQAGVNCLDCHLADQADRDAIEHEGGIIATIVSPKDCGRCHIKEFQETEGSVHAKALALIANRAPALTDNLSDKAIIDAGCTQCHGSRVQVRGDGSLDPATWPNTGIGRINPDGSHGACSACHGRHKFSKAQARQPEACTWCHTGPDSPDDEVYAASKHGMLYSANKDQMNLAGDAWILGKDYSAAPTCVTCHMGATPGIKASHDVGMRDAWSLNGPVSERQHLIIFEDEDRRELAQSQGAPRRGTELDKLDGSQGQVKAVATADRRRQVMSKVCIECHSKGFVQNFMQQFDDLVELYNEGFGKPAQALMNALYDSDLLSPAPFDEPIEYTYWRLWHDDGTRARHGAAMMSPNLAWWEGMHRVAQRFYGEFLPQLRQIAGQEKAQALIDQHVLSLDQHHWLKKPSQPNPLLGFGSGRPDDE
jgi:hypothetical protein